MRLHIPFNSLIFIFLIACNDSSQSESNEPGSDKIESIMGLSPALTEILYFACPDSMIVARSQACNFPEEALDKPIIQTYPLDIEGLIILKPDMILNEEGIISEEQINLIKDKNLNIKTFNYRKMDDVFNAITEVSKFCDCELVVKSKIDDLKDGLQNIPKIPGDKKALGLIWNDPIYVYGSNTLFSDQLKYIGIENSISEDFNKQYPEISREYLLKINPDIIIGGSFKYLDSVFFKKYPELKRIRAYQDSAIYDIDSDLITRPGPRSVLAIQEIYNAISED